MVIWPYQVSLSLVGHFIYNEQPQTVNRLPDVNNVPIAVLETQENKLVAQKFFLGH